MKTIESQVEEMFHDVPSLIPTRDGFDLMKKNIRRNLTQALQERDRIAREEEKKSLRKLLQSKWKCYCGGGFKKINIFHTSECRYNNHEVWMILSELDEVLTPPLKDLTK